MTFEERIEKLTARHEALAMTVELLTHDVEAVRKIAEEHNKSLALDGEHIRALVRIAEIQGARLTDHDERLDRLEG